MINLQEYTFLVVLSDGTILEGAKLSTPGNHYQILEEMSDIYPDFGQVAVPYDLKNPSDQIRLYNELVYRGAVVYHSWVTFIENPTNDANVYLPNEVTLEQKEFMDSIMEQLNMISNIRPYELCDRGYLEISNLDKGAQYVKEHMESHLVRSR